jgi:CheY-like chemotaxis protein
MAPGIPQPLNCYPVPELAQKQRYDRTACCFAIHGLHPFIFPGAWQCKYGFLSTVRAKAIFHHFWPHAWVLEQSLFTRQMDLLLPPLLCLFDKQRDLGTIWIARIRASDHRHKRYMMFDVLVVDDQVESARMLLRLIRQVGYDGECAFNGQSALDRLKNGPLPRLVILDQMMPGLDGVEVLRQLRAESRTAHLHVVIFSAIANPTFAAHVVAEGADAFWEKGMMDYSTFGELIGSTIGA